MAKRLVYLDNAATTPVRPEVLEAMLPYLGKAAFGNPSSAHRFGRTARAGVEEAKRSVAAALGAGVEPGQVIFTSGARRRITWPSSCLRWRRATAAGRSAWR